MLKQSLLRLIVSEVNKRLRERRVVDDLTLRAEIKQTKPFRVPEEEVVLNIMRTNSVLNAEFVKLAKSYGITQVQYNILRILRGSGADGLPCVEIGSRMITPESDMTRLIDRLEKAGLVRRHRSSADRRIVEVMISEKGQKVVNSMDQPTLNLLKKQLGHLSKDDLGRINDLMLKARTRPTE